MRDWRNIEYLRNGNDIQKKAYQALTESGILAILRDFDPIVVGTIPINIDIPGSDIDIVCNVLDINAFQTLVRSSFSKYNSFTDRIKEDGEVFVASFKFNNLEIEIYASDKLSTLQNGYRHMLIEERILSIAGEDFRNKIISLKKNGYKTEPAFGILLKLESPYQDLLQLYNLSDAELIAFILKQLKN